jgi:hypothetical protein
MHRVVRRYRPNTGVSPFPGDTRRASEEAHMTSEPSSDPIRPSRPVVRPLPASTMALAGVLLLIPLVALAIVPVYAKAGPRLWGFPFFYWYQFLWVFLASGFTYCAHMVINHARRGQR